MLNALVERLKPGLPFRNLTHVPQALLDGNQQKDVFKNHPAGMFEPAPGTGRQHAEDRLRPEDPAQQVIHGHDHRGRNQHAPIPIKCQERQRTEHVKMGFNAAARQMDEQG